MDCGKHIKAARIAAGLTQAQLAAKCDIATITIRQYESGKRQPRYEQLECLADALDVPLEVLLGIGESVRVDGAAIAADVINRAGLTLVGDDGNVIHQGDGKPWKKVFPPPTPKERIDAAFERLNDDGQEKAAESVEIIAGNPLYQRTPAPETPPAPPEGTDTAPLPDAPQQPQEGK